MANSASVSGSTGYNIPVNALDGGDAGPSRVDAMFGNVAFQDGVFQVGDVSTSAYQPQSQSQTPTPVAASPLGGLFSGSMGTWLMIGGAALLAILLLRRHG